MWKAEKCSIWCTCEWKWKHFNSNVQKTITERTSSVSINNVVSICCILQFMRTFTTQYLKHWIWLILKWKLNLAKEKQCFKLCVRQLSTFNLRLAKSDSFQWQQGTSRRMITVQSPSTSTEREFGVCCDVELLNGIWLLSCLRTTELLNGMTPYYSAFKMKWVECKLYVV